MFRPIVSLMFILFLLVSCQAPEKQKEEVVVEDRPKKSGFVTLKESSTKSAKLEHLSLKVQINATADKVYQKIIDKKSYEQWASVYDTNSSSFEGDWKKGSKMYFYSIDDYGNKMGMLGRIKENVRNQLIIIEYYGTMVNGEELGRFKESTVKFILTQETGYTELELDWGTHPEQKDFFHQQWSQILNQLKRICEN